MLLLDLRYLDQPILLVRQSPQSAISVPVVFQLVELEQVVSSGGHDRQKLLLLQQAALSW